ncbi:MAG TPA: YXWGXW repeat-containing protein [Kofleriaceae bacterium]|nr:YXWGXW repeat-containing protein [Kofleriaceae bacterium]
MRGTIRLVAILCVALGGTAFAGHGHGGGKHGGGGRGRVVVRDHRSGPSTVVVRDHRAPRVKYVRASKGRYVFPGGVVRVYKKPRIERYYDVHVRPAVIVESYDPVPGYVWVSGGWTWGGSEWVWTPGYWAVADEPVVTGGVSISAGISIH